jgi:hypothetical protein
MNRTESTCPQHSYVLEVGVIIGGVLSVTAFRHELQNRDFGSRDRWNRRDGAAGRKNTLQSSDSQFTIGALMTKRPAPPRTLISRNASMANPLNCSPIFKDSLALGTCLG